MSYQNVQPFWKIWYESEFCAEDGKTYTEKYGMKFPRDVKLTFAVYNADDDIHVDFPKGYKSPENPGDFVDEYEQNGRKIISVVRREELLKVREEYIPTLKVPRVKLCKKTYPKSVPSAGGTKKRAKG